MTPSENYTEPGEQQLDPALTDGDRPADSVPMRIVQHVASVTDRSALELPPLYDTIDTEALDTVVDSVCADSSGLKIKFEYAGCAVTVTASGAVHVESA